MCSTFSYKNNLSLSNFTKKTSLILPANPKISYESYESHPKIIEILKKSKKLKFSKTNNTKQQIFDFLKENYELKNLIKKTDKFQLYEIYDLRSKEIFLLKVGRKIKFDKINDDNCLKKLETIDQGDIKYAIYEYFESISFSSFLKKSRNLDEKEQKIIIKNLLMLLKKGFELKIENLLINPTTLQIKLIKYRLNKNNIDHIWLIGSIFMRLNEFKTMKIKNFTKKYNMITSGDDIEGKLSNTGNDLLKKMTNKIPEKRITIAQAESHEWFKII